MTPKVSVVVEWDNAVVGGLTRARDVIREIAAQCAAAAFATELVFVFDDDSFDPDEVRGVVRAVVPEVVPWTLLAHPVSRYYEQKNRGGAKAAGEIIVFCDSDCRPEPGFLTEIIRTFDNSSVEVAASACYTEYTTPIEKAFALTWNFPVRSSDGPTRAIHHFNANGVAFRRVTFARFPFPEDERFRGECHSLAEQLSAHEIEIVENPKARVSHPAPPNLRFATRRALCQGHDRLLTSRQLGIENLVARSVRVLGWDLRHAARRVRRDRGKVELRWWEVPAVVAVSVWYPVWSWIGWLVTLIRPTLIRRHLRV